MSAKPLEIPRQSLGPATAAAGTKQSFVPAVADLFLGRYHPASREASDESSRLRHGPRIYARRAVPRRSAGDFLWFTSSDFFLTLPQSLPRHRSEVVLLIVGDLTLPHDEDDF